MICASMIFTIGRTLKVEPFENGSINKKAELLPLKCTHFKRNTLQACTVTQLGVSAKTDICANADAL